MSQIQWIFSVHLLDSLQHLPPFTTTFIWPCKVHVIPFGLVSRCLFCIFLSFIVISYNFIFSLPLISLYALCLFNFFHNYGFPCINKPQISFHPKPWPWALSQTPNSLGVQSLGNVTNTWCFTSICPYDNMHEIIFIKFEFLKLITMSDIYCVLNRDLKRV